MTDKPSYKELEQRVRELTQTLSETEGMNDALRENRKRLHTLWERLPLGYHSLDEGGNLIDVNPAWLETLGYSREEVTGKPFTKFLHPDSRDHFKKNFPRFKTTGETSGVEFKMLKKDGSYISVSFDGRIQKDENGNFQQTHCILKNITARKQAEEALRESAEKYRVLFEHAGFAINLIDAETLERIEFNRKAYEQLGYSRDEYKNLDPFKLGSGKSPKDILEHNKEIMAKGSDTFEAKRRTKHGEVRDYLISAIYVKIGGRNCIHNISVDITDRKQAEEALRDSEEKYRDLFEQAPVGYMEYDTQGRITKVNQKQAELLGYTVNEMIGEPVWRFVVEKEAGQELIRAKLNGEKPASKNQLLTYIRKDGTWFTGLVDDVILKDKTGRIIGIRATLQDISERMKREEEKARLKDQLRNVQKLEAIGTLAGGIAHEFNNALSPISINLDLLEMDFPGNEKIAMYTRQMKDSANRIALLSDKLLAYARGGKYKERILPANDVIRDTLFLIRHDIDSALRIDTDIPHDIFFIKADVTQMQMALSGILMNASEAMEGRGTIRVICRNETITDETIMDFPNFKPGDYVSMIIEDDGKGMDGETRDRIFEPFFTTKFQGRGLGMAATYGIIKNHGGFIKVDSEPGKGTAVHIYMPAVESPLKKLNKPDYQRN